MTTQTNAVPRIEGLIEEGDAFAQLSTQFQTERPQQGARHRTEHGGSITRIVLTATAVLYGIFGSAWLLMPAAMGKYWMIEPGENLNYMGHRYGAFMLGLVTALWLVRNAANTPERRAVVIGALVTTTLTTALSLYGALTLGLNAWPATVTEFVMGIALTYVLLLKSERVMDNVRTATAAAPTALDPLQGIVRIHLALRRSLDAIVRASAQPIADSDRAAFADFCARFARLLKVHHDGEEEIVFPTIEKGAARASLSGYSTEVGHWRGDHEKLLVHLAELEAAAAQLPKGGQQGRLRQAAKDLQSMMLPHLDAEEAAITDPSFKNVLTPDEILEMLAAAGKHGQKNGGPGVLVMIVHSLSDKEQKAHFGEMPWVVRKLLLKRIWAPSFRPCLKYAHNPSIAL